MSLVNVAGARSILRLCAIYFAVCGMSATWFPASWLWASGLSAAVSNELTLTFGVIGAYMLALAVGAYLASREPIKNSSLTATLAVANIFDFFVTLRTVLQGLLPTANGILFLVVAVLWTTLLALAWRARESV